MSTMVKSTRSGTNEVQDEVQVKVSTCSVCNLPPWRLVVTVIACVVVEATLGVAYTNGNLLPYMTSYLRNVTEVTSLDYSQMMWVDNSMWLTMALSLPLVGLIERKMSARLYILIGVAFHAVAFFGTYWAVQTSFALLVIVNGVLQGIAQGVLYPAGVKLTMQWFPHRKGLVGGVTMAGYGGGAFIWNQVVTRWINPHNLQPDSAEGDNVFFTQPEVLGQVPTCYLLLGGIFTATQLLCVLVVTFPPDAGSALHSDNQELTMSSDPVKDSPWSDNQIHDTSGNQLHDISGQEDRDRALKQEMAVHLVITGKAEPAASSDENQRPKEAWSPPADDQAVLATDRETTGLCTDRCATHEIETRSLDYTPRQIMTSRVTWMLWLNGMTVDLGFLFVLPFYKAYGFTFIRNDHFLSLVASFGSVFNAAFRPVWGVLADRIGFLPTLMLAQGMLAVTTGTFVTCELSGSSAMYFVWVCAMFVSNAAMYGLHPSFVASVFGPRHFVFSLGIVSSQLIVTTLMSPPLVGVVLDAFGWRGLFYTTSGISAFGVLILSTLLFNCGRR
ncbi:uncharacterized protein [Littorina saxatilis]